MKKSFAFTKKDFILIIILSITVLIVEYSLNWYKVYKEHNFSTPIISKYVVVVTPEEFKNYITENSNTFVYMGIPEDSKCRNFENKFKKTIVKYNLRDEIVYLNVKTTDLNAIYTEYSNKDINENNYVITEVPVIAVYNNSKIVESMDYNNSDMKEKTIVKMFRRYGIID